MTKPRPQITRIVNWVKFKLCFRDIRANRQTNRHTYRLQYFVPLPLAN